MDWQPLINAALRARERAYAPYSRFRVGAALLGNDGTVFTGCNVENRSYGLTICAERNALAHAVAEGIRGFEQLVVASRLEPPAAPCGMCRETLSELAPDLPILLVNPQGERLEVNLRDLLPHRFDWAGPGRS